jgi:DNA-binding IclR family transcriptional regulator
MTADPTEAAGRVRPYPAPALEKGLEIIELLAAAGRPLSTRAIADNLGRSKGEIFRMLCVLMDRGYLNRDPATEELTLSGRLFDLGIRTPRARQLMEVAVPAMEHLSQTIAQSVHLVVLSEGQTVVIANSVGSGDVSFTLRLGYRRPAVEATSGQVMLAFQDAPTRLRNVDVAGVSAGAELAAMSRSQPLPRSPPRSRTASHSPGCRRVCRPASSPRDRPEAGRRRGW